MATRKQRSCNQCGNDIQDGKGIALFADIECKNKVVPIRASWVGGSFSTSSFDFCDVACMTLFFSVVTQEVEGDKIEGE